MKVFISEIDLGKTITYKEENGKKQYLYTSGGFEFESLKDYKDVLCNLLGSAIAYEVFMSGKLTEKEINAAIEKVRHNKYEFEL